jgi:hypothetical protein
MVRTTLERAQVAMAVGHAASSAKTFKLEAVRGSETNGIVSNPFLEHAFKTLRVTVEVTSSPGRHMVVRASRTKFRLVRLGEHAKEARESRLPSLV